MREVRVVGQRAQCGDQVGTDDHGRAWQVGTGLRALLQVDQVQDRLTGIQIARAQAQDLGHTAA